jgi:hypothetical protein
VGQPARLPAIGGAPAIFDSYAEPYEDSVAKATASTLSAARAVITIRQLQGCRDIPSHPIIFALYSPWCFSSCPSLVALAIAWFARQGGGIGSYILRLKIRCIECEMKKPRNPAEVAKILSKIYEREFGGKKRGRFQIFEEGSPRDFWQEVPGGSYHHGDNQ